MVKFLGELVMGRLSSFRGLAYVVGIGFWLALGTFISIAAFLSVGWIAIYASIAVNLGVAYFLNQSRSHNKGFIIDDKIPENRMENAETSFIQDAIDRRRKEEEKRS